MKYEPTPRTQTHKITPMKDTTAMEAYKKAKATHKAEIKQAKADIRKHRLLIKQAKLTYRLTKGA